MSGGAAAFFDVDGTLVAGNIVQYYADLRTMELSRAHRALWFATFALRVPWYLLLDTVSRGQLQRAVYGNYRGFDARELERRAQVYFDRVVRSRLFAGAVRRVREHRQRGDRIVLVTGSLRPIVAPLAAHLEANELLAADLEHRDGTCTGRLREPPLAHERKAGAVRDCMTRHGLDPAACWAYADSLDDVPMLAAVGHAGVVEPGRKLARIAAQRGWEILRWSQD
jgi:HAD superfamily hydrolase (TIGR01490 family)